MSQRFFRVIKPSVLRGKKLEVGQTYPVKEADLVSLLVLADNGVISFVSDRSAVTKDIPVDTRIVKLKKPRKASVVEKQADVDAAEEEKLP